MQRCISSLKQSMKSFRKSAYNLKSSSFLPELKNIKPFSFKILKEGIYNNFI